MNKQIFTPETDASCGYALSSHYGRLEGSYLQMDRSGPFVHAEFARKLERERDEAMELAQQMSESNQVLMADVRFYRNAWEQLKEAVK
jgi:hypothetical protein